MIDQHDRLRDDVAALAVGSLEVEDLPALQKHLSSCAECSHLLHEYQAMVTLIPTSLPPSFPRQETRDTLMKRVRGEREIPSQSVEKPRPRLGGLGFSWRGVGWLTVVSLAFVTAFWGIQPGPRPSPSVAILARMPGGRIVELTGTGAPGSRAELYVPTGSEQAELALSGLLPLQPDRTYQLWFARPGQPTVTGGAFRVDGNGQTTAPVLIPVPLSAVSQIAVTEEPAPGGNSPTGAHLLDWLP